MATRPIFMPRPVGGSHLVEAVAVDFTWHPGLSRAQKQKSIDSLHAAARAHHGVNRVLEISSKSREDAGIRLSAFNLMLTTPGGLRASVESLFQGSKVFVQGGPYQDLYQRPSLDAKRDERLRVSGDLMGFRFEAQAWPTEPKTLFYDGLYLSALGQNHELADRLLDYDGFSDIEFNPEKSLNGQAAAAARYCALRRLGLLDMALASPENLAATYAGVPGNRAGARQVLEPWMLGGIEALVAEHGTVPPPWVVHDEHPCSLCWRMGSGESHMILWQAWWARQGFDEQTRIAYFRRWPPPHCWLDFLIEAIWDIDPGAGGETLGPYFARTAALGFGTWEDYERDLNDPKWLEK